MDTFRINVGRCVVTENKLRIEKSVRGFLLRIYEGSKLFFVGLIFVVLFLLAATVTAGPADAGWVVLIGTFIGLAIYFGIAAIRFASDRAKGEDVRFQRLSRDKEIPLSAVTSIECLDTGIFPKIVIKYEKDGTKAVTKVTFPYRFFSFTEEEFAAARSIFKDRGLPVTENSNNED